MRQQKNRDFTDELAAMLPGERIERAKRNAEKEIFQISLSELRKKTTGEVVLLKV